MLGLAVLTALNVADELFRTRDLRLDDADTVTARASALEQIVDQALALAGHNRGLVSQLSPLFRLARVFS